MIVPRRPARQAFFLRHANRARPEYGGSVCARQEGRGEPLLVMSSEGPFPFVMSSEAQRSRDIWPRTLRSSIGEAGSRPEAFSVRPMELGANAGHGSFAARSLHCGLRPPVEMTRMGTPRDPSPNTDRTPRTCATTFCGGAYALDMSLRGSTHSGAPHRGRRSNLNAESGRLLRSARNDRMGLPTPRNSVAHA
jgi:hypothetical protein